MKKGHIYTGIVERVAFPNKGIVWTEEGEMAVVKHAVTGQKVSFSVKKVRKGKGEGRLLEVLERSPLELEQAPCPYFGECGGCAFLNFSYENQLELKVQQVRELLEPVVDGFADIFEGAKESPRRFAYRNKMEFSFGDSYKGGPLALGMHKRGSFHDIVTVAGCRIADKDYSDILSAVLEYFQNYGEGGEGVPYYHKHSHQGYLRHLLVRKAVKTGEILVGLVTSSQIGEEEGALLEGFCQALLALELEGKIVGVLHTRNDSLADAVIDQGTQALYGVGFFYEELLGLRFRISPFSFFQTNSLGAEVLYETARQYIAGAGDGKVIYDLYSGTGTIAQMLSPVARKVIGVEIVEEAVEAARENAIRNGLDNCEFLAGDVLKVLDGIEEKPDFIVLDPPRDGIHPKALDKIIRFGVERMAYISCKPTSLARDLKVLQSRGYAVERVCCVDMFPFSANIETVCLLSNRKSKPDSYVDLSINMEDYHRIKNEEK